MSVLIKRFYSSKIATVRPCITFKNKVNNRKEDKIFSKNQQPKELFVREETLDDYTSPYLLKNSPFKKPRENMKTKNKLSKEEEDIVITNSQKIKFSDHEKKLEGNYVSSDLFTLGTRNKPPKNAKPNNKQTQLLYGIYPVFLALKSKRRSFFNIYFKKESLKNKSKLQDIHEICQNYDVPINYIDKNKFYHLLGKEKVHQGVCLEASALPSLVFEDYSEEEKINILNNPASTSPIWLYLDRIMDPMNFGALLRTAYYFGVDKIFTSLIDSCPISNIVSKASSGVAEILPVYQIENIEDFMQRIHKYEWNVVSSVVHSTEAVALQNFKAEGKLLLVVGNEGQGVSPVIKNNSDTLLTIPPASTTEDEQSLNVGVATSIILYHLSTSLKRKL